MKTKSPRSAVHVNAETPPKKLRGNARMREFGYKLVQVWLDKSELASCEEAARACSKTLANFVRESAKDVAFRVMAKK
jgi:hypothetical protein